MIRLGKLIGLPAALEGRILGRVEEAVLTRDGRALQGLVLRHGMGGARWAPAESIRVLGSVSVILGARPQRYPGGPGFAFTCVKDTAGLMLGRVTDVYIHGESFRVTALEITLGLMEELACGRMLARQFTPEPQSPGQVLIPCGCTLEPLH